MDCIRRRYTRNPSRKCRGSGPLNHPTDPASGRCFTCEDLARMHNGGPCGHKFEWTKGYWNKIKGCMEKKCGFSMSGSNESCDDAIIVNRNRDRIVTEKEREELDRQSYWERQSKKKL